MTCAPNLHRFSFLLIFFCIFFTALLYPQALEGLKKQSLHRVQSPTGIPLYQRVNINNLILWGYSEAGTGLSPRGSDQGIFPRGAANILYSDRMLWGAKVFLNAAKTVPAVNQPIRIGGGTYGKGTKAGRVIGFGSSAVAADPNGADVRIYRIRRDYAQMTLDELRRDAAETNEIPIAEVSQAQIDAIRNQYTMDWSQWPVQFGAPYIERNGVPGYQSPPQFGSTFTVDSLISGRYDEPGIVGANSSVPADQVLWTVYNDLDRTQCLSFALSEPMGLELQLTIWGYKRTNELGNVIFRRLKIINKGGIDTSNTSTPAKGSFWIDSMYVAQWSDSDIGNAGDDLVGCDTLMNLSYYYNGQTTDNLYAKFNLPPPSLGYVILQGPTVASAADSAIFNMKRVYGRKNLPMTSSFIFASGDPYSDPPNGLSPSYDATSGEWWKVIRGYAPLGTFSSPDLVYSNGPFPPSRFPFSGDPVSGTGWIDGQGTSYSFASGDRRIIQGTGPFSLAPGDTQEVVIAVIAGLGSDRLSSIVTMRHAASLAQAMHNSLYSIASPPAFSVEVSFPSSTQATLKITADDRAKSVASINTTLRRKDRTPITSVQLFDDGLHGDNSAQDGVFANAVTITREQSGSSLDAVITDTKGNVYTFAKAKETITTAGVLEISNPVVFLDNINNDGKVNPGENITYGFSVKNNSSYDLTNVRVTGASDFMPGTMLVVGQIKANETYVVPYVQPTGATSPYLSFFVLPAYSDSSYRISFTLFDQQDNRWEGIVSFPVVKLQGPVLRSTLSHVTGNADGSFIVRITDSQVIKNHTYVIHGLDSVGARGKPGFMLKDSADGRILISNSDLPDSLSYNIPVTDGFKVFLGTVSSDTLPRMKGWSVPAGTRRWSALNASTFALEGFDGAMSSGFGWYRLFGAGKTSLSRYALKNVLIKFAGTDSLGNVLDSSDPNWSYAYRYVRRASDPPAKHEFDLFIKNKSAGYAYQEFAKSMPLSAWDIEANPPRRLSVGHLENNVSGGRVDGKYWPPPTTENLSNTSSTGPREWFFIFDVQYAEFPDSRLTVDVLNAFTPIMWFGFPTRLGNGGFQSGDQFLMTASHIIGSKDMWVFNPTIATGIGETTVPWSYSLAQNYPNPFNPSTQIEFTLAQTADVILKVYNLLGQEIVTLVDDKLQAGMHRYEWNGKNNYNASVATGVYFYRITAGSFVETKKMVLMK